MQGVLRRKKHLLQGCGATFQPDKTKLTLPGPPRCHHSMLMSWGPLSVRAVQPEVRGVCEPRVDM